MRSGRRVFGLLVIVGAQGCALAPEPARDEIAVKALPNTRKPDLMSGMSRLAVNSTIALRMARNGDFSFDSR